MNSEKALELATIAHEGQKRKTTKFSTPYIEHPIRVAETLRQAGFQEEVVMAAYLHDTIEDTYIEAEDIEREFGQEVLRIVLSNTENKTQTWEERKKHTIESISTAPIEVKALVVADKLDNLSSIMEEYNEVGEKIWSAFHRGRESQAWYYKGVAANCMDGIIEDEAPAFFHTYKEKVNNFFA